MRVTFAELMCIYLIAIAAVLASLMVSVIQSGTEMAVMPMIQEHRGDGSLR
jgi:hypothetical protein